jgi:hypothetical protein
VTRRTTTVIAAAMLLAAGQAGAQVGYEPHRSPFRDLRETQEISFFSGYYRAKKDPARIVPQSGSLAGVHYQWRANGPAHITADVGRVSSQRQILDPEKSGICNGDTTRSCKLIGTFRWPLYTFDAGMAMSLTGARSFFRLVPEVKAGVGVATDFHTKADVGDFAFGTRFALTWGAGIRWLTGGPYQVRFDVNNHFYSVHYPQSYYEFQEDGTRAFDNRQSKTVWLNNPSFTIGISYLFSK